DRKQDHGIGTRRTGVRQIITIVESDEKHGNSTRAVPGRRQIAIRYGDRGRQIIHGRCNGRSLLIQGGAGESTGYDRSAIRWGTPGQRCDGPAADKVADQEVTTNSDHNSNHPECDLDYRWTSKFD